LAESLAFGKPCIAADIPSLREIAPELPTFVDPLDTLGWARAIETYANDVAACDAEAERIRQSHSPTTWDLAAQRVFAVLDATQR
jgi:glycosyltransferase involved in cell wall biosynthesis